MRIAKYLAECGIASRRKSEELVRAGKVTVNGQILLDPATNVDPSDVVTYNGKEITGNQKVYYLVNKPAGYVSTTTDIHDERIVTELVPKTPSIWPVGRLDKQTEGLLILTNDGELTQRLTHPSFQKDKEYEIAVDRPLSVTEQETLRKGITLDDGPFKPDKFVEVSPGKYRISIHEGRNRLIRRSISYFHKEIVALRRVRIAFLTLSNLGMGKYRILTKAEVERLKNA